MSFSKTIVKIKKNKFINILILFWNRCNSHDIVGIAAKSTYYMLLSFFPLILILISVTAGHNLQILDYFIPPSLIAILEDVRNSIAQKGAITLVSSILLVWSASTSIHALMRGIYIAHTGNIHEKAKKGRFWAIIFTLLFIFAAFICTSLTFFSGFAINELSSHFPYLNKYLLSIVRTLIIVLLIFVFTLSLYIITPGDKMKIRNVYLGAIFSSIGWIAVTWGYEIYMKMFNNYSLLYGTVGVFLGLALWLYLIALVLLIGAEINAHLYERKNTEIKLN